MASGVRFLHLADVHIGFRVTRFDDRVARRLREARFQALDNVLRVSEEGEVDFIVISGDLFDDNAVSLTDAQRAYDMLKGRPIPVYVLPGNHDPHCAGSVWRRHPWSDTGGTSVHVLGSPNAVAVSETVSLYPCPVTHKTSREDPTEWIEAGEASGGIRIGVAHGSVMDRATLPLDDHPIPMDAWQQRRLDYLALGHWHQAKVYGQAAGGLRMAYPGTLEQMSFPAQTALSVGWTPYSPAPDRDELAGSSEGQALLVQIAAPGAVPIIESVECGHYVWVDETVDLTDDADFAKTFSHIASRENPERCLLRLTLKGVLSAASMVKLDGFQDMLARYMYCDLNLEELYLEPQDESVAELAGHGVVGEVLERIREVLDSDPAEQERLRAQRAILLLYRLAREVET